jgi:hypothetical protein
MLSFFVAALLWRGLFLPFNQGCYTDGILQIECFRYGMTYWPPLYAVMARMLAWIPGVDLEAAGRTVALLAGALAVWPLGALARRLFGLRAAFWTMTVWLASPLAMRWSVQVMTDMPAAALWIGALAALAIAVEGYLPGLFPDGEGRMADPTRGNRWLLIATGLAAMTTLTRYQGILLLPLTAVAAWRLAAMGRALPNRSWNPWLTQAVWVAVPVWVLRMGMGPLRNHFGQIGERAGGQGFANALLHVYWNMFESFLAVSPYCVTYGLFGFLLYGLMRTNWATARLRWMGWAALYLTLAILILQSVFSSFQERYLLPLIPLVCLFAGHGLAAWERKMGERSWRFWILAGPAVLYGLCFSALVAVFQGSPFLDIKQAAATVRSLELPADRRIVTNEVYNDVVSEGIGAPKVNFWSGGHPVARLGETSLKPGDVVLVSSWYAGSPSQYLRVVEQLKSSPAIEAIGEPIGYTAVPLLPDLMTSPQLVDSRRPLPISLNQNPMAWNMRYMPQSFQTTLLRVRDLNAELIEQLELEPLTIPPPRDSERKRALTRQLIDLGEQLDALQKATTITLPAR